MKAALPRMVAEVLSPSTRDFDTFDKLEEYKTVTSLDYVLVVEPNAPETVLWFRSTDRRWERRVTTGLDGVVGLPDIGVSLALSEIYDGVVFPSGLALVQGGADAGRLNPKLNT